MRLAIIATAAIISSCAHTPIKPAMRVAAGASKGCSDDAVVVFFRPTRQHKFAVEIREEDGTFIGQLDDETWFSVPVAPGRHFFVAAAPEIADSRPSGLMATLMPGMVYYVEVRAPKKYPMMFAASPARRYWDQLQSDRKRFTHIERDPAVPAPEVPASWPIVLNYVRAWWSALGPDSWAERSLVATDSTPLDSALAQLGDVGATCAAKPESPELYTLTAAEQRKQDHQAKDTLMCFKQAPIGSHIPKVMCASERELAQSRQDSALLLFWISRSSHFEGN
jgi:hypothetical protein